MRLPVLTGVEANLSEKGLPDSVPSKGIYKSFEELLSLLLFDLHFVLLIYLERKNQSIAI